MPDRKIAYAKVNAELAGLSDDELTARLAEAAPLGEGIGGTTYKAMIAGLPVFVKRIPLTDLEQKHPMSTANLFGLPTHYQYGVGSAGFGAWRELQAHLITTDWVRSDECPSFPLLYHWRVLPRTPKTPDTDEMVRWWEGDQRIATRLEAIDAASASIVLFLEFVPQTVHAWVRAKPAGLQRVEADLLHAVDVMNRNGMLHFDAHFNNIMADDEHIYVSDFGLATSTRFDLSATERDFVAAHATYDRGFSSLMLAMLAAHMLGHSEPVEYVRGVAAGDTPADDVVGRHAAAAVVMHDFFEDLRTNKRTPYPAAKAAAALASK